MMLQPRKEAVLNDQVVQALVCVVKEREQVFFLAQAVEVGVEAQIYSMFRIEGNRKHSDASKSAFP